MDLIKRANEEIKFADGSVVVFDVERIPQEEREVLLNTAKKRQHGVIGKKNDDIFGSIDWRAFNRMVILRAIKGWSGLQNRHLPVIYDCKEKANQWEFKGDKKRETEIPFSEEARRELAEMYSVNFISWMNNALDAIDEENIKAKEAELKN